MYMYYVCMLKYYNKLDSCFSTGVQKLKNQVLPFHSTQ